VHNLVRSTSGVSYQVDASRGSTRLQGPFTLACTPGPEGHAQSHTNTANKASLSCVFAQICKELYSTRVM